jgi:hypothetical protein
MNGMGPPVSMSNNAVILVWRSVVGKGLAYKHPLQNHTHEVGQCAKAHRKNPFYLKRVIL